MLKNIIIKIRIISVLLKNKSKIFDDEKRFKIILKVMKMSINNCDFQDDINTSQIFKYLLLNNYDFDIEFLKRIKLFVFQDEITLAKCLEKTNFYHPMQLNRHNKILFDAINSKPTIKTYEILFEYIAEEEWKKYRKENMDDYINIFDKICSELRHSHSFNDVLAKLLFLPQMNNTLNEKYDVLLNAMSTYFNIYHSKANNKQEQLRELTDTISNLSAQYISKSKEKYKKYIINQLYDWLKQFFILNVDNPQVNKLFIQKLKKEQFIKMLKDSNETFIKFAKKIVKKYNCDYDLAIEWMKKFIFENDKNIEPYIPTPPLYDLFEKYEKATKLINRLNNGYITYNSLEVANYKDIISFDEIKKEFVYTKMNFEQSQIDEYKKYRKKIQTLNQIKKDITMIINSIELDKPLDYNILENLENNFPFTDKYFKFNSKYLLDTFTFKDITKYTMITLNPESLTNDELFEKTYNLLINKGIFWLTLLIKYKHNLYLNICLDNINEIVNNLLGISSIAKEYELNLDNYSDIELANYIFKNADNITTTILGTKLIEKLYKDNPNLDESVIINSAAELVCNMVKKNKSTVPYINSKYNNYKYSLYDSLDETILLAGIYTDSCFKIGGHNHDFLHYCALNKNGFIIKITDEKNNFIARASGFRNGNCIYINQLRTIYDRGGKTYYGGYENERIDIIQTLKNACEDMVLISQYNELEETKIDFVFVTGSYALDNYVSNVTESVINKIGKNPMENKSKNWKDFQKNTNNLNESSSNCFSTDYSNDYSIICIASSKKISDITPKDIIKKDVPALYERKRNKIIATNKTDIKTHKIVNKIKAINSFLTNEVYEKINIPDQSITFIGDNWYIICNDKEIINSCVIKFDELAKKEFEITKNTITQYILNNNILNFENLARSLKI